jgi:hypothetical protein
LSLVFWLKLEARIRTAGASVSLLSFAEGVELPSAARGFSSSELEDGSWVRDIFHGLGVQGGVGVGVRFCAANISPMTAGRDGSLTDACCDPTGGTVGRVRPPSGNNARRFSQVAAATAKAVSDKGDRVLAAALFRRSQIDDNGVSSSELTAPP